MKKIFIVMGCMAFISGLVYMVSIDIDEADDYLFSHNYKQINIQKKSCEILGDKCDIYNPFLLKYHAEHNGKLVDGYLIDVFGIKNIEL
jgi:hypothetical protein